MKSLQIITVGLLQGFKSTDAIYSNISLSFDFLKPVTDFWSRKYENFFLLINKQHFCSYNFRFLSQNADLLCQISPNIVHNWENHNFGIIILTHERQKYFCQWWKQTSITKWSIIHHTIRYPYSQLCVMKKNSSFNMFFSLFFFNVHLCIFLHLGEK